MPATQTPWEADVDEAMQDCLDVFGEGDGQATYLHVAPGSVAYALNLIFEAESIETDPNTGAKVISNTPQVSVRLANLQAMPANGDIVTVRGIQYRVKEPQLDGQGTATLRLWRK